MPAVPPAATELSAQVLRLTRQIGALRTHLSGRQRGGLEWSSYVVLFHLVQRGPMRSNALADIVCADPSTVSRQTGALVDSGLVERLPDPDDGRAVQLAATDRGRDIFTKLRKERDALIASVLVDWDGADVQTLATLLDRFTNDLERKRPQLLQAIDALENS